MVKGRIVASAASLALALGAVAGIVGVAGAAPHTGAQPVRVERAAARVAKTYKLTLVINVSGPQPKYVANGGSSADIRLPANTLVSVTLRSYDNGVSVPTAIYGKVSGTVGGTILLAGKAVRAVPLKTIAHTFTIPALGLNVPVPAVKGSAKYVQETFEFKTAKAGTYAWQFYAPCGTGASGWGGPMVTPGQMMGQVTVG